MLRGWAIVLELEMKTTSNKGWLKPRRIGADGEPTEVAGVAMDTYVEWMRSCSIVSATRCPALSVPCGAHQRAEHAGLPIGLQIVTGMHEDQSAVAIGKMIAEVL